MDTLEKIYKKAIQDLVNEQIKLFGINVALNRVSGIQNLEVSKEGKVVSIKGDSQKVIQNFVSEYSRLFGLLAQERVKSLFEKYPNLPISSI